MPICLALYFPVDIALYFLVYIIFRECITATLRELRFRKNDKKDNNKT